ncbi:hypothetical protein ACPCZR_30465 [Bacillus bombysepticus]
MKFAEVLDKIQVGQVAKRIFEEAGDCNDRIIAIFFDGEQFGYLTNDKGIAYSVVLDGNIVHDSKYEFTNEYDEDVESSF